MRAVFFLLIVVAAAACGCKSVEQGYDEGRQQQNTKESKMMMEAEG